MSAVRMRPTKKTPLARAVIVQARVLARLAKRWFAENHGTGKAAFWSQDGVLLVFANGYDAERIAGELERAGLIHPQMDTGPRNPSQPERRG